MLKSIRSINLEAFNTDEYDYQPILTFKLDETIGDFDQSIINEIVLWKVNRYADFTTESLNLINLINKNDSVRDDDLTSKILLNLLDKNVKGVRLPRHHQY